MSERSEEITMQCVYGKCDVYVCVWKERERARARKHRGSRLLYSTRFHFRLSAVTRFSRPSPRNIESRFPAIVTVSISQMTEFHLFHPKNVRICSLRKHMTVSGKSSYTVRSTTTSEEQTLDSIAYPCTHSMTSSVLVLVRVLNQHRRG